MGPLVEGAQRTRIFKNAREIDFAGSSLLRVSSLDTVAYYAVIANNLNGIIL